MRNNIKNSVAGLVLGVVSRIRAERGKATAQRRWLLAGLFAILTVSPGVMAQDERPLEGQTRKPMAVSAPTVTATASSERVRYAALGEVNHTRLQVFSTSGAQIYDSNFRLGNLIDWQLVDQQGTTLADGTYLFLVTVKDFSNQLTQKYATALLEQGQVSLEQTPQSELSPALRTALENNQQTESISLVDRIGASGLKHTAQTVPTDGTTASTASTPSTGESDATGGDKDIGGVGTQNQIAKWLDNAGNLGDSIISESGGNIGIDTLSPTQKLHVATGNLQIGSGANSHSLLLNYTSSGGGGDITSMMNGVEMLSFGFNNTGQLGGVAGTASGRLLYFFDRQAAAYRGGFNSSGEWYWGPTTSRYGLKVAQPNVGVTGVTVDAAGNVGIGTIAPTAKLHLSGVNSRLRLHSTDPNAWTVAEYVTNNQEWHTGVGGSTVPFGLNGKFYIYDETAHLFRMVIDQFGRVGIGTTNPTATLDVNGSIKISPTTRYKSIHGAAFMFYGHRQGDYNSVQPYVEYNESGVFGMYNHDTSNDNPFWTASVELPDGAVITEFCISAAATQVDFPVIAANLYKTNLDTGGTGLIARTFIAEGTTSVQNVCIDSNEIVNNNRYAYSVKVDMERGRLIGARIKYQVTQLP